MTISAYVGWPGSGKSHSLVKHVVVPALRDGRTVYHNLELHESPLRELAGPLGALVSFDRESSAADLVSNAPPGAVVIIDEVWRYWRAGLRANAVPDEQFQFFAMHRHSVGDDQRSMDIYIVSQDLGSGCASFIRDLVDTTYRTEKLDKVGASNRYRVDVFRGPVKGHAPPESARISQEFGSYDPQIFRCYASHTLSVTGSAGSEVKVDKRASVFRSWRFRGAIVALLLLPVFLGLAYHEISSFRHHISPPPAVKSSARVEHSETLPTIHRSPSSTPTSPWYTAGDMVVGKLHWVVLQSADGYKLWPASFCHQIPGRQWFCRVDQLTVTPWHHEESPTLFGAPLTGRSD